MFKDKNNIFYEDYICKKHSSSEVEFYFINNIRFKYNFRIQSKCLSHNIIRLSSVYTDDIINTIKEIEQKYDK